MLSQSIVLVAILGACLVSNEAQAELPFPREFVQRIAEAERALASGRVVPAVVVRAAQALLLRADDEHDSATDDRRRAYELARAGVAQLPGLEDARTQEVEWIMERLAGHASVPCGLAHVTFVSYCTLIPTFSLFSQMGAAKTCAKALELAARIDAAHESGAPLRALALFRVRAPAIVGGDNKAGLPLAEKALALAPRFAPNLLVYAKVKYANDGDKAAWERRLREIVALPDDAVPELVASQQRTKADAARRLKTGDTSP